MGTYMVTGEGKDQFFEQLKELLGNNINGVNALVLHIEDEADFEPSSLEAFQKAISETNKAFKITKIYC